MERMKWMNKKIGMLEKGKFRFIAANNCSNMVKYGKLYESDELGNIELEDGYVLYTYGDRANFLEQMELFIGSNDFIEIKDERHIEYTKELVNTLHYGDCVEFGDDSTVYRFIRFVRNEAVIQHTEFENLFQTAPVHWLRRSEEDGAETEAV